MAPAIKAQSKVPAKECGAHLDVTNKNGIANESNLQKPYSKCTKVLAKHYVTNNKNLTSQRRTPLQDKTRVTPNRKTWKTNDSAKVAGVV